ncbi:probable ubiquitin carboxyl-terminal hydrolase FAF isoform X2 [Phlebotomus papatasi]|uniref:probable ubiquitin carboxyl-terminal hydrolase FAF isoform X2 n=1 Tax=Phlebotomus papatasi TaxID=29031 RepID=UPI002483FF04|nr:probable ubiquitin carboxyl-terminal hydrolase FAF isoform X2 [Phlebotomus papatasi]
MTYDTRGRTSSDQQQSHPPQVDGGSNSSNQGGSTTGQSGSEQQPPATQQQTVSATSSETETLTPEELIASFPLAKLNSLTTKISSARWVVPVLPEQELECLLNSAIALTSAGVDHDCEPCMRFYRDGLTTSFMKILTDEAVNSWKYNIHYCILMSCGKLLQLTALHMKRDNPYLLDLLAVVLDPDNKFHTFNASRQPEIYLPGTNGVGLQSPIWGNMEDIYAVSPAEPRHPKGWLVDLLNRFGQLGGFDNLLERFNTGIALLKKPVSSEDMQSSSAGTTSSLSLSDDSTKMKTSTVSSSGTNSTSTSLVLEDNNKITLPLIHALVRPFGQCYELLTIPTIEKYFMPIWGVVLELLDGLTDEELKKEAKPEGRSDSINGIVRAARCLASRLPNQENLIKELEMFRLKMILRLLQVSSFNGKMNALNEINKVLSTVAYYPHRNQGPHLQQDDEMDWLTAEKMAKWIKDTDVLGIVLKDSLHQPQYVEKLEKILRFLIKEKSLTLEDLNAMWRAQAGKHEAIVKNLHDLLAKLAWDFNAEQLDYLFDCFQASMTTANKKQRERLLELIRRLAEDDKNGLMANKVLKLFWTLAHSAEVPPEVLDQALASHVKILDYSCSQERDAQKQMWLTKCVEELKSSENWALPALRLIREICCLYEATANHQPRQQQCLNRQHVIERLQNEHTLVILVTHSLTTYMDRVRTLVKENADLEPNTLILDGRYPHPQQLQERLDFLKFLLKDGQLWLCADQAEQIWNCLAVNAAFPSDREECFRWFGKLMGDEPDLDPGINKDFFEKNLLQLDPQLLTESGIKCFERFFKAVNSKELKLQAKFRGYVLDDEDLIGKDYLWRVITTGGEEIACKAIELLKEVSTALGPRLQANVGIFHENFIDECCDRLRSHYDNVLQVNKIIEDVVKQNEDCNDIKAMRIAEADKMCRVLRVLQEYIKECDRTFNGDRYYLPLSRACRGKYLNLYIRFQNPGRQIDDMEIITHSNETVAAFKRNLLKRIKGTTLTSIKVDLYYSSGELIEVADDRSPLSHFMLVEKTMLTAKLTPMGVGMASSPDSSSDSSTGSPPRPCPDMTRLESEASLPGVIISQKPQYVEFFLKLYQLGSDMEHSTLRECSLLLHLLPLDRFTMQQLETMCAIRIDAVVISSSGDQQRINSDLSMLEEQPTLESMFLHATPAQVLYNLEVLHAMLIPALEPLSDGNLLRLQSIWLYSGVAHFILELLTKNNFLPNADMNTKRAAFQCVLRLAKLFLYIVGCVLSRVGDEPVTAAHVDGARSQVEILKQLLTTISGNSEQTLKTIASKLAQSLAEEMLSAGHQGEICRRLFGSALQWSLPDMATIKAIVQLAWAASCGCLNKLNVSSSFTPESTMPESMDFTVCKEALDVLTISLVLNPNATEALNHDMAWPKFITSLVLMNPSRHVRKVASDKLFLICTYCAADRRPFTYMVILLVGSIHSVVPQYAATCAEFFQLLCRILNYGCLYNWPLPVSDVLFSQEITWLRTIRSTVKQTGETQVHEDLLEGHLNLAKELMFYLSPESKGRLNSLIQELVDDFLFPASRQYLAMRRNETIPEYNGPPPVCRSSHTIAAACDLLVALCQNSVPNMKLLVNTLMDMFCSDTEPLREWEYLPPVGPRSNKGFCGLKNAGATCYMNSVLQQLYMVPSIRLGILSAAGACTDPNEDFSGETDTADLVSEDENNRRNYHVGILKHVQAIFAHLGHSALQFYVPRGLWSHFKLQGEPVNLREQQDAVEFFMSLFESLDEGLKALGHPQLMGATLGGCFSDQKICQECPHRYSKEEPFSVFSVDIRNHSSLTDSLEQYVKGELLEGADAYHCDKCDKKVVTVKRLCVRKLPPVLAIQLKRFEYDYERVCAIKFNDYFEFSRILDMEPYTVSGLAKIDGEVIEVDDPTEDQPATTKYQLTGIVVHSGQASGGHYFSYILHRDPITGKEKWYKFDDGEVSECKMHEDEEMKTQCFGGDYMGEVYDNNLKRMQYRRQKRWWNAYMLFYTRCDQTPIQQKPSIEQLSLADSRNCVLPMPEPIEKSVRSQNIRFLHSRSFFSPEFFNFILKLVNCSVPSPRSEKITQHAEELLLLGVQLASQFLFHSGFRTKKTLRGAAIDWYEELKIPVSIWYDSLCQHVRHSAVVRSWFAQNALLNPPTRLAEYILIAPSPEVRAVFVKLVVFFCHFAINDDPIANFEGSNLCEQVLISVLSLLKGEVAEHGKHLPHYFSLFCMYAGLGLQEKHQLLKLNVPAIFMQVALDDGPGPPIKYQYPEWSKLHQVVSHLVRCSDVSSRCTSSKSESGVRPLPNPYLEPNILSENLAPLSPEACEYLFGRTTYVKKVIEDTNVGDEGLKLLQYCSWENPHFSRTVLTELMWQCGFAYWHDMRHHTDLLLNILLMEDSWQHHRIHNALLGVSEEREGLLDTIMRSKIHYQKRAYQIIKCLVQLFRRSPVAHSMLSNNAKLTRQWTDAVEWLQDELERTRSVGGQYNYSSWSPPAQSNDSTNGYMLERSQSAKNVLQAAVELFPEEEPDEPIIQVDTDVGQIDETGSATTVVAGPEFVDPLRKDDEVTAAPGTVLTTVTATTGHSTAVTTTPAVVVKNDSVKAESNEGEMTFMMILNKTMTQMRVSSNQSPSGVESDGESSTTRTVNQRSGHTVQMEGNALTSSGEGSSSTTTTITTTTPAVNSTKQKFEQT